MFHKLIFRDREEEAALPLPSGQEQLTRYGADAVRPPCSAHLTRFSRRHTREEAPKAPQPVRETAPAVAVDAPAGHDAPVLGPELDLYSDQPVTIDVLKRALPQRFAQVQADISDAFQPQEKMRKTA